MNMNQELFKLKIEKFLVMQTLSFFGFIVQGDVLAGMVLVGGVVWSLVGRSVLVGVVVLPGVGNRGSVVGLTGSCLTGWVGATGSAGFTGAGSCLTG